MKKKQRTTQPKIENMSHKAAPDSLDGFLLLMSDSSVKLTIIINLP